VGGSFKFGWDQKEERGRKNREKRESFSLFLVFIIRRKFRKAKRKPEAHLVTKCGTKGQAIH
jgi:hypothetical protein